MSSLRTRLSALIALLAVTIAAAVSGWLTQTHDEGLAEEHARKARLYARLTGRQLEPAVAFDDRQTAREAFDSLRLDGDVTSVAVYREDGTLLEASGPAPERWGDPSRRETLRVMHGKLEAAVPVVSREGPRGTVMLALGTERLEALQAHAFKGSMVVGVVAAGFGLFLAWLIAGVMVARLARIAAVATRVASGDLTEAGPAPGRMDEIGRLTTAFNAMLSHLQRLMREQRESAATEQERLNALVATRTVELERETEERKRSDAAAAEARVRDARHAGMAEVATGVLHNVGNALNSVGVSVAMLRERLHRSRLSGLQKGLGLLKGPGPLPAQLPTYLEKVGLDLQAEQQELLREVEAMRTGVEHMTAIVGAQQSLAKGAGRSAGREPVKPTDVFEEALSLGLTVDARRKLTIERDFAATAPLLLDRHRLVQILVNLISNAAHAMAELPDGAARLVLRAVTAEGRLTMSVRDNGCGIAAEQKVKIFAHGFTTKPHGHGFGLHASACAALEMGGTLGCASEGPGMGSTFALELPAALSQASALAA